MKTCFKCSETKPLDEFYAHPMMGQESSLMLPPRIRTDSPEDRFMSSFEERNGCWLWDGDLKESGYGLFCAFGKKWAAHRASWMLFRGPIPDGLHVLHRCDVRNCVNPDHLWLGTHSENMQDMTAKGRRRGPAGEAATWAILDEAKVREILASDEPGAALARRFGVGSTTIYAVRNGRTWKGIERASS